MLASYSDFEILPLIHILRDMLNADLTISTSPDLHHLKYDIKIM